MELKVFLLLGFLAFRVNSPQVSFTEAYVASILDVSSLNRSSFPDGFIFGTASSAYQYEGAANKDGRGPSIWDTYTHKYPERIKDGGNRNVTADKYHRYKEDTGIMKCINLDAYRFSIPNIIDKCFRRPRWPEALDGFISSKCVALDGCLFLILPTLVLLFFSSSVTNVHCVKPIIDISSLNRSSFPIAFIFGTASSSYQYEGEENADGKGPSIWGTYAQKHPDKIMDRSNGDIAIDSYHRYKEDVGIMKDMNLDAYRFSISWSRILPKGKLSGGVNKKGIEYYNNLIDELLANGLEPFVTIFHWDLPQALEDEYGGFLSPNIVDDFGDYAELCFKEFGDRVKHWITLNEPYSYSSGGYATGIFAPGRCSDWLNLNCTGGDSRTEPYLVSHHQLLAHAKAVKLYKTKYQASQKGVIGITLVSNWYVPFSDDKNDRHAAERAVEFMLGWFLGPITTGKYPHSMRSLVGRRLPKFSRKQRRIVKGSMDFLGLNYYTTYYAAHAPRLGDAGPAYHTDSLANLTTDRDGRPIGPRAASSWLYIYPKGFRDLLLYTKTKYNNPLIYITENGMDEFNDPTLSLEEALIDTYRIDYYHRHLYYLHSAIKDGVNVKGYFAWSLLDNFEWNNGYTVRFGINFVDYKNGLKRHQKLSAKWFTNFLKKH